MSSTEPQQPKQRKIGSTNGGGQDSLIKREAKEVVVETSVPTLKNWIESANEPFDDDDLAQYLVVSCSNDKTIRLWDSRTGEPWKGEDGKEHHLIARSSEKIAMDIHHDNAIRSVLRSENGRVIVSASEDARIRLWDVPSGECVDVWKSAHKAPIACLQMSGDHRIIASASWDKTLQLWDVERGKSKVLSKPGWENGLHPGWLSSVALSKDASLIVTGCQDKVVRVWSLSGFRFQDHAGNIIELDCLELGAKVEGRTEHLGHAGSVWAVALSADCKTCVSGGGWGDASVIVWDLEAGGNLKYKITVPNMPESGLEPLLHIDTVAIDEPGQTLFTGGSDGIIRIYDLKGDPNLFGPEILTGHPNKITKIALSADLKTIATTSCDKTVRLWDLETRTCRSTMIGHTERVMGVSLSSHIPDARPQPRYTVSTYTSDMSGVGASVSAVIIGMRNGIENWSVARKLSKDSRVLKQRPEDLKKKKMTKQKEKEIFKRGAKDEFFLSPVNGEVHVGEIIKLKLIDEKFGQSQVPTWRLKYAEVQDHLYNKTYYFWADRWLSEKEMVLTAHQSYDEMEADAMDEEEKRERDEELYLMTTKKQKEAVQAHTMFKAVGGRVYETLPPDKEGPDFFSEDFGQKFYPPGFRWQGETVEDAIQRWFDEFKSNNEEEDKNLESNSELVGTMLRDNANTTMEHIWVAISRNMYTAFLHDIYAQQLQRAIRAITLPLIFINALSSALGSLTLMGNLTRDMYFAMTIATTILNLIAAVLVAVQKFYNLNERAALHENIKDQYFKVIHEQERVLQDFCVDKITGQVSTGSGKPLEPKDIRQRLKDVSDLQKKLKGVPDEPVPEAVANKLQPFIHEMQKKDGFKNRDETLHYFPNVLGLRNFFSDSPEMTGMCGLFCGGTVCVSCGSGCPPLDEPLSKGCDLMCCGLPCWSCGKSSDSKKVSNHSSQIGAPAHAKRGGRPIGEGVDEIEPYPCPLGEGVEDEIEGYSGHGTVTLRAPGSQIIVGHSESSITAAKFNDKYENDEKKLEAYVLSYKARKSNNEISYAEVAAMRRPGVKLHEAVWTWWKTKRQESDEEKKKKVFREETRKKKSRSQNFSEIMNKAMSRNLYTAMLHDLYAQMLKNSNNWIAMPLILMNATNSALSASTLSAMPAVVNLVLTLTSVGLNILSALLVAVQKFYSFAERAALHDSVKNGFFEAYYSEEDLVSDLAMDSNGVFMTVVDKGKEDHLRKEDELKKAEDGVEKALLERLRAEEDLKRAHEEVLTSKNEVKEAGGEKDGVRDEMTGLLKSVQTVVRNQAVYGKTQSVLSQAEDRVKIAEARVDKAWWGVKKAERRKREAEAEIKQARQEKKRADQAGGYESANDKVIQALDENEIDRRLQLLADIEERLLALPDVHIPVNVARKLQPFVKDMQHKGGFDSRSHLQLFPPVLGVQSHFLNVPKMMGWFSFVSSGDVIFDFGSSCSPINHESVPKGYELLCCGSPCLQCCGQRERDGPDESQESNDVALNQIIQDNKDSISYQNSELYKCLAKNQTVADRYRAAVLVATLIGTFRSLSPERDDKSQLRSLILIIKLVDLRLARYVEDPVGLSRSNRSEVNETLQRLAIELGKSVICLQQPRKLGSVKVEKSIVGIMNEIFGYGWIAWMEERQMTENLREAETEAISIFDNTVGKGKEALGALKASSKKPGAVRNSNQGLIVKVWQGLTKQPSTIEEGLEYDIEAGRELDPESKGSRAPDVQRASRSQGVSAVPFTPPTQAVANREADLSKKLDQMEKQLALMTEMMSQGGSPMTQGGFLSSARTSLMTSPPAGAPASSLPNSLPTSPPLPPSLPFAPAQQQHPAPVPSRAPASLPTYQEEEAEIVPLPGVPLFSQEASESLPSLPVSEKAAPMKKGGGSSFKSNQVAPAPSSSTQEPGLTATLQALGSNK